MGFTRGKTKTLVSQCCGRMKITLHPNISRTKAYEKAAQSSVKEIFNKKNMDEDLVLMMFAVTVSVLPLGTSHAYCLVLRFFIKYLFAFTVALPD
jgi:hypothetical protein